MSEIADQIGLMIGKSNWEPKKWIIDDAIEEDEVSRRHYAKLLQEEEAQRQYEMELEAMRQREEEARLKALEEKKNRMNQGNMAFHFGLAMRKKITSH